MANSLQGSIKKPSRHNMLFGSAICDSEISVKFHLGFLELELLSVRGGGGGGWKMARGPRNLYLQIISRLFQRRKGYIYNRYKTLFAYQSINKSSFSMNFIANCVLRTLQYYPIYYTEITKRRASRKGDDLLLVIAGIQAEGMVR